MKLTKWALALAAAFTMGVAAFAVACGETNSSSDSTSSSSSEQASSSSSSSETEDKTVTQRFAVGETTNVSVPAGKTVYCAIDETAGSYVLEWDSIYAKITIADQTYTGAGSAELKNIDENTVIEITTTDGGRATVSITCTLWQPPMLSLGENDDIEVAAKGETALFRFSAPHAGVYAFQTQSATVAGFSVTSDKAFTNPAPLTAAGTLSIEVQAGAEIKIELSQSGESAAIIPVTVTDETQAATIDLTVATPVLNAPASGRAYYVLPLDADTYVSWTQANLALTIAGKTYTGAQSEPILVKYDARSTVYIVAASTDGNAITNAALTLQKATTSTTITTGENSFVVAKNKTASCTFTAPDNGTYTFSYAGSTGISEISFISGVNFPTVLAMTDTDETAQTLTATVVKGAELVLAVSAGKSAAASVLLTVSSQALETQTLSSAQTVNFSLAHSEFKCYEITAQGWYKINYTNGLTENFWQFSCAVNLVQIASGETGYATAGDLLIIKATLLDRTATVDGSFTLQADDTVTGTTSAVLTLGENHVINRNEQKVCTFTAAENGTYRISTTDTNTKIIYKLGATNADNECITGADDGLENSVVIELKAGETYTLYLEMLQSAISDNNDETVDPILHLDVLSFTIEKI